MGFNNTTLSQSTIISKDKNIAVLKVSTAVDGVHSHDTTFELKIEYPFNITDILVLPLDGVEFTTLYNIRLKVDLRNYLINNLTLELFFIDSKTLKSHFLYRGGSFIEKNMYLPRGYGKIKMKIFRDETIVADGFSGLINVNRTAPSNIYTFIRMILQTERTFRLNYLNLIAKTYPDIYQEKLIQKMLYQVTQKLEKFQEKPQKTVLEVLEAMKFISKNNQFIVPDSLSEFKRDIPQTIQKFIKYLGKNPKISLADFRIYLDQVTKYMDSQFENLGLAFMREAMTNITLLIQPRLSDSINEWFVRGTRFVIYSARQSFFSPVPPLQILLSTSDSITNSNTSITGGDPLSMSLISSDLHFSINFLDTIGISQQEFPGYTSLSHTLVTSFNYTSLTASFEIDYRLYAQFDQTQVYCLDPYNLNDTNVCKTKIISSVGGIMKIECTCGMTKEGIAVFYKIAGYSSEQIVQKDLDDNEIESKYQGWYIWFLCLMYFGGIGVAVACDIIFGIVQDRLKVEKSHADSIVAVNDRLNGEEAKLEKEWKALLLEKRLKRTVNARGEVNDRSEKVVQQVEQKIQALRKKQNQKIENEREKKEEAYMRLFEEKRKAEQAEEEVDFLRDDKDSRQEVAAELRKQTESKKKADLDLDVGRLDTSEEEFYRYYTGKKHLEFNKMTRSSYIVSHPFFGMMFGGSALPFRVSQFVVNYIQIYITYILLSFPVLKNSIWSNRAYLFNIVWTAILGNLITALVTLGINSFRSNSLFVLLMSFLIGSSNCAALYYCSIFTNATSVINQHLITIVFDTIFLQYVLHILSHIVVYMTYLHKSKVLLFLVKKLVPSNVIVNMILYTDV